MKITEITKSTIHYVATDEEDYCEYTRHSALNWTRVIGESDEPVHYCEELESMFQKANTPPTDTVTRKVYLKSGAMIEVSDYTAEKLLRVLSSNKGAPPFGWVMILSDDDSDEYVYFHMDDISAVY